MWLDFFPYFYRTIISVIAVSFYHSHCQFFIHGADIHSDGNLRKVIHSGEEFYLVVQMKSISFIES